MHGFRNSKPSNLAPIKCRVSVDLKMIKRVGTESWVEFEWNIHPGISVTPRKNQNNPIILTKEALLGHNIILSSLIVCCLWTIISVWTKFTKVYTSPNFNAVLVHPEVWNFVFLKMRNSLMPIYIMELVWIEYLYFSITFSSWTLNWKLYRFYYIS